MAFSRSGVSKVACPVRFGLIMAFSFSSPGAVRPGQCRTSFAARRHERPVEDGVDLERRSDQPQGLVDLDLLGDVLDLEPRLAIEIGERDRERCRRLATIAMITSRRSLRTRIPVRPRARAIMPPPR